MNAKEIKQELVAVSDPEKAAFLPYFFKTGKGQYAEGDKFIGVVVPKIRTLLKTSPELSVQTIKELLMDEYHECRLFAVLAMVRLSEKAKDANTKKEVFELYISQREHINNWDLVDLSAPKIVGAYLIDKDRGCLRDFAQSSHLWTQRIAIISTFYFIRKMQFRDTFELADILMNHPHDLIHKAVGWMLREVGKRNFEAEYEYLVDNDRYRKMPRTMLRYSIEKFPEEMRQDFLKGRI